MERSVGPLLLEVGVEKGVAERPHGERGPADVAPDRCGVLEDDGGGKQLVALAAEGGELGAGLAEVARLVVDPPAADQHLVGAEHQPVGVPGGHPPRLQLGQGVGDVARQRRLGEHGGLDRRLVDAGGDDFHRHAAPDGAPRRAPSSGRRESAAGVVRPGRRRRAWEGGCAAPRRAAQASRSCRRRRRRRRFLGTELGISAEEVGAAAVDSRVSPDAHRVGRPSCTGSRAPALTIPGFGITRIRLCDCEEKSSCQPCG